MVTPSGFLASLRANCRVWSAFGALLGMACGGFRILAHFHSVWVDTELVFFLSGTLMPDTEAPMGGGAGDPPHLPSKVGKGRPLS